MEPIALLHEATAPLAHTRTHFKRKSILVRLRNGRLSKSYQRHLNICSPRFCTANSISRNLGERREKFCRWAFAYPKCWRKFCSRPSLAHLPARLFAFFASAVLTKINKNYVTAARHRGRCIPGRVYICEFSRSTAEVVMKLFACRVLVKHRHVLPCVSAQSRENDEARFDERNDKEAAEEGWRGDYAVSVPFFRPRDSAWIASAKKLRGNTRGVISEMETRSLACADIKETFLSRKNNMHHARCLLCARILSSVYSTYI